MKILHLQASWQAIAVSIVVFPHAAIAQRAGWDIAQITPDTSVGSTVTPNVEIKGVRSDRIEGGTIRGSNLFHSFSEFNIQNGRGAYFTNPEGITNIFSRITGNTPSNINGILGVLGNANLFLLNPNGIIFGPNARLDLKGSFMGTTANSINFADGTNFSTINPQAGSLLTVSVPIGLGFGSNPAPIQVQGTGHSLARLPVPITSTSNPRGLQVSPQRTLALVGGNITLAGGTLTAESGQIELGSIGSGSLSLSPNPAGWTFDYSGAHSFGDIQLVQRALLNASGQGGGAINLRGQRISLADGSLVLIQNHGLQPGGNISIKATQSLNLTGSNPDGTIRTALRNQTVARGNGGDVTVSTERLTVENGGLITTNTYGAGVAGNIFVNASQFVQVVGFAPVINRSSAISAQTAGSGSGGNVTLFTERLHLLNGGLIGSTAFNQGAGGDVTINAAESIEVIGIEPSFFQASALTSGAINAGNAGSLTVNTGRLIVRDGGRIDSSTAASGAAGSVTVNASEFVEVSGTVPGSRNPSLIISSANIADPSLQQLFRVPPIPTGASGEVTINTAILIVRDGAQVTVKNDGTGDAGTLRVNASEVFLEDRGGITASTASGNGGNILARTNHLQMRRGGSITTTAGGTGNGGNITLDVSTIAMLENSDITANAVVGRGGNIAIATQALFGSPNSDITASSQLGVSGTINVSVLNVNQQNVVAPPPSNFVSTDQVVGSSCLARGGDRQGILAIVGNGGLPETPETGTLPYQVVQVGSAPTGSAPSSVQPSPATTSWKWGDPIVEATEFSVNAQGQVVLTAKGNSVAGAICHPARCANAQPQPIPCQPN